MLIHSAMSLTMLMYPFNLQQNAVYVSPETRAKGALPFVRRGVAVAVRYMYTVPTNTNINTWATVYS